MASLPERAGRHCHGVLNPLHSALYFSPDLLIYGGGVSKDAPDFLHLVDLDTEIIPATLRNRAGIIGAAAITAD